MKKKWLAFGVAVALGLSGYASTVSYAAEMESAEQGTIIPYEGAAYKLRYSVEGDTVTITGIVCEDKTQGLGKLVIPSEIDGKTVTGIGENAFYDCSGLTGDLIIPEGVTRIGDWAFYDCSGLTGDLIIPEGVTRIGDGTFFFCNGFNGKIVLPDGVVTIGDVAFSTCCGLTGELKLPDSVTMIGNEAFAVCFGLTGTLMIPEGVTVIGNGAFRDCIGFTGELKLPDSVTKIGDRAFLECSGFTGELKLPDNVATIGEYAFGGCSGFTGKLTIPDKIVDVGVGAFCCCKGLIGIEAESIRGIVTSFGHKDRAAVLELEIENQLRIISQLVSDNNASYEIGAVTKGTYTLNVSKADHVTREYTITVEDEVVWQDVEIWLIGDVNGDGAITARDKKIFYNHIAGTSQLTGYEASVGDVNGDGSITARDKKMIYSHIAGTTLLW